MRTLKIYTLPSIKEAAWLDRDYIMLHACFQLLTDFVEKESILLYEPNDTPEGKTIKELYDWWVMRREKFNEIEEDYEKDEEQLMKLISVRTSLWT